mmetsp:Transcript_49784/g.131598  ORF Transcript_49784/g.131598 Transcript_49784/m.131598 type:complete len:187 (-) Transcript_49784:119-679(-)
MSANGAEDIEVYRSLASEELQVEVRPVPGAKRRRLDEVEDEAVEEKVEASDEEDEQVSVVLCDQGPKGGGMNYYLKKGWERPSAPDGEFLSAEGTLVPAAGAAAPSRAEIVEQDEDVETILEKIVFQMDQGELADTPWRQLSGNLQDHFNFDIDESQWKVYVLRQIRVRLEARQRQKIAVPLTGGL